MHQKFFIKRLLISNRSKPMFTVIDSYGHEIFIKLSQYGQKRLAWPLKRQARGVADYCQYHGIEAAKLKLNWKDEE